MLDFCADASEGPIRAYLLDVADTEEQDMALNIHAFSAGKTHRPQRLILCLGKYLYVVYTYTNNTASVVHQKSTEVIHTVVTEP